MDAIVTHIFTRHTYIILRTPTSFPLADPGLSVSSPPVKSLTDGMRRHLSSPPVRSLTDGRRHRLSLPPVKSLTDGMRRHLSPCYGIPHLHRSDRWPMVCDAISLHATASLFSTGQIADRWSAATSSPPPSAPPPRSNHWAMVGLRDVVSFLHRSNQWWYAISSLFALYISHSPLPSRRQCVSGQREMQVRVSCHQCDGTVRDTIIVKTILSHSPSKTYIS